MQAAIASGATRFKPLMAFGDLESAAQNRGGVLSLGQTIGNAIVDGIEEGQTQAAKTSSDDFTNFSQADKQMGAQSSLQQSVVGIECAPPHSNVTFITNAPIPKPKPDDNNITLSISDPAAADSVVNEIDQNGNFIGGSMQPSDAQVLDAPLGSTQDQAEAPSLQSLDPENAVVVRFDGVAGAPGSTNGTALAVDPTIRNLLDRIALGEGTGDAAAQQHGFASGYDVTLGYGAYAQSDIPLSQMTLDQVIQLQTQILNNPDNHSDSSAVGRYEITRTTLLGLMQNLGLSGNEIFSPDLQDQLGQALLEGRGLNAYTAGSITSAQFQDNLSNEWASIARYETGQPARPGQHLGTTTAQIQAVLLPLQHH